MLPRSDEKGTGMDELLALDGVGLVLLDSHDAVSNELAIMDDMVGLRGKHALNVIVHVAEDDAVSLGLRSAALRLGGQRLDLEALEDGDGKLGLRRIRVVEDEPGEAAALVAR